ncbi:MAG TPA: hypothetical protein PL131_11790 [Methylotenera sp.]|nr:hypothetical protein [Methylotenera sp.]HPH06548.1 hypothetical protein [Methylotenera sp.]HPN01806.1 hypothetical protein [Methylotenera sp.]
MRLFWVRNLILASISACGLPLQADEADFNINPLKTPIITERNWVLPEFNQQLNQFFAWLPKKIYVDEEPEQHSITDFSWVQKNNYQLGFTDKILIRGMVLSTREYHDDNKSDIAPMDIVIGWKKMSDPDVVSKVYIMQNRRFYFWKVNEFPISRGEIEGYSTNLHIVPDNEQIASRLKNMRVGDIVSLEGYLTDVKDEDERIWVTSRVRNDSGDGACEIVLVKNFSIIDRLKPN